jgi:signal transduction histidine kinase
VGSRLKLQNTIARAAMFTLTTQCLDDARNRAHFDTQELGKLGVRGHSGLVVPLKLRGRAYGVLVAIDRLHGGPHFTAQDQRLLEWFAASAATAVVTALSVAAERERERVAAAEEERGRWSRELHEGTMQRLAGLRLALASAQRAGTLAAFEETVSESIVELRSEIANLRSLSFELRPTTLDDLGVEPAITHLADEARRRGINVELRLEVPVERQRGSDRYSSDLETAIYRIVQEALTNVQKHARATRAQVTP